MTVSERERIVLDGFVRGYPVLRLALRVTPVGLQVSVFRIIVFHSTFPILAVAAAVVDNSFNLNGGRGVLSHYGFHALFLSAPTLVLLCCWLIFTMARIIADPVRTGATFDPLAIVSLQHKLQTVATRRTPTTRRLLWYGRMIGVTAVVANAASTRYPQLVYGQDVFDSSTHPAGYIVGRLFLSYYWIYLLPLVAYFVGAALYLTYQVVKHVEHGSDYELRCFAADGCAGFKDLGQLMKIAVYTYVPIVAVIVALSHTHRNFYPTLQLSAALVLIIPAQLFLPFLRLHRLLATLKTRRLLELERLLTLAERRILRTSTTRTIGRRGRVLPSPVGAYLRLLAGDSLYQQTMTLPTWPYVRSDALKWVTPFIPMVTSAVLRRYGLP